ncbi:hypothetical protein Kpol_1025p42 [Vanderwaltozyma polyspora DSM 70294]|uniref:J domain-containing protein n=1 Tax=Vanderwaltozyma polyspora (strain ATCC 22028 / DSM 70294 / BCRC 21397 / CBS 2163 / NBRC 10782 / NRRL Y-8283 / UCD 57-17) TaxID=436907 RepID=A7TKW6_VANPO|nr:uncharacterized protein Kpol_1025p42 [Vanderwaltozyma polyspora DSM 70294]EDO17121.1 hypothetical protein Kpol_1025p42 [Vanderwaltozyma polyspora DSM 70294]
MFQLLRFSRIHKRSISSFYELFPKNFPNGKPVWSIDNNKLRKEYRSLQSKFHPDAIASNHEDNDNKNLSSLINKAYQTLKNPLDRSQYLLKLIKNIDLSNEEVAQNLTQNDPNLLLTVLDVHEQLEDIDNDFENIKEIELENKKRIMNIEQNLNTLYENQDYDKIAKLTIELKYWVNLSKAIKEWEPRVKNQ